MGKRCRFKNRSWDGGEWVDVVLVVKVGLKYE